MHLSDGVVELPGILAGFAVASALCAWSAHKVRDEEIPRIAVFTAAFFVASLMHLNVPGSSVHLTFNGLVGVVLGRRAFLVFPIGLFLQAALFGHGGLSVLGVNICIFGLPTLVSWRVFELVKDRSESWRITGGVIGGFLGVALAGLLLTLVLLSLGEGFKIIATTAVREAGN